MQKDTNVKKIISPHMVCEFDKFKEEYQSDFTLSSNILMEAIINDIEDKKMKVVKDMFTKKGFGHLLEGDPSARRFKRITIEHHPDREEWWADDGSDSGVLIVTFVIARTPVDFNEKINSFSLNYGLHYHG